MSDEEKRYKCGFCGKGGLKQIQFSGTDKPGDMVLQNHYKPVVFMLEGPKTCNGNAD